ncbi:TonB-dependent receptor [Azoarcus sp. DD4]|uniref:TonB-dependent receptor n=1 Tax=Azoarcus sp. DD4 TaxID=2027405 RepID=UPI0011292B78|nr:TonB-dependent receptor [Azoarcus sp. DD4]QDF97841.1 TonB-dependent receptor [Azoarcus sp. DD4]
MRLQFTAGNRTAGLRPRLLALAVLAAYQGGAVGAEPTIQLPAVEVIGTTPLPGIGLPIEQVPANVQTVKGQALEDQRSLTVADYMAQNMTGVNVNETQNNPFQPNVNFRGFTASPLLGTPQGLSVYQDGVRINEPFGDVVSWDLIPVNALANMSMMPGSNPLFGLNTLGGAISMQTKRGYTHRGGAVEVSGGSWGRYNAQAEFGGVAANGVDYFIAGNYFDEDGWRDASPSEVRQVFGQLGWRNATTDLSMTLSLADNDLIGNGLVQREFLSAQGWDAINTKPDQTENKLAFLNFNGSHWLNDATMLSANAYYRNARTRTLNGDANDDIDPDDADFDLSECVGGADEDDAEISCSGALNRSKSRRVGYGVTGQINFNQDLLGHQNLFIVGLGYEHSRTDFEQTTEFGTINAGRGVDGIGVFGDEGEVELRGVNRTWSVFATDTFSFNSVYHLTVSGRYNHTRVENRDQLIPDRSNPESLTGDHSFRRFNPAIGLAITPSKNLSFYASYNEGSRAPTAIELGCANPDQPCKLPNAMAGDPPLDMVVSKTFEGGVRGKIANGIGYSASLYRTENTDDIQFIAANSTGAGYFSNVGKTRREGVDLGLNGEMGTFRWFAGYSYIKATYQSNFSIANEVNSSAVDTDSDGDGDTIFVSKGDRLPGIPRHQFKVRGEWQALPQWTIGANVVAFSSQYSHGNENNDHRGAGGKVAGYAVVNLDTRYNFGNTGWQLFAKVNNLFDKKYHTGGMLGETFFEADGTFMGGDDEFSALVAPGAPRAAWIGVRYAFDKPAGR